MIAISGEPLSVDQVFNLTGYDAICEIHDYNCRIMNFSPNQSIEVIDIVEWKDRLWGIKKLENPKDKYQYFAFIVR